MEVGGEHERLAHNPVDQGRRFRLAGLSAQLVDMRLLEAVGEVAIQIDAGRVAASHIVGQRFAVALLQRRLRFGLINWQRLATLISSL